MRTSGSAEMTFSGSWFPFVLSGTYRVQDSLITKSLRIVDLREHLEAELVFAKMILQNAFEPILLDLNIILDRPAIVKNSLMDGK